MKANGHRLDRIETRVAKQRTEGEPITKMVLRYVKAPPRCPLTGRILEDPDWEE